MLLLRMLFLLFISCKTTRELNFIDSHWRQVRALFKLTELDCENGQLPFIQPLADWRRKRDFPVAYNPELASN